MSLFSDFLNHVNAVIDALSNDGKLPSDLDRAGIAVEPPRDASHGDMATNAAMVLAGRARMKPRDIAEMLKPGLEALPGVEEVAIAGPGFINLRLGQDLWQAQIKDVLGYGSSYGDSEMGAGRLVNVEYVSANPTGPMHVGHVRGAVYGDALANLLMKVGYQVTKEYYINDAGVQIDMLARSVYLRYCEALGRDIGEIPEGLYPGDYLKPVGQALADQHGEAFLGKEEGEWLVLFRDFAKEAMMDLIRDDLARLGITHEVFFSEATLHGSGRIKEAIDVLRARGHIYEGVLEPPKGKKPDDWEPREQTLFKATAFGDDVDRPIQKSDGEYTYFAADIAYHYDKYTRGFKTMIDILGADHSGYVKRVNAAIKAMADDADFDARLCQLVRLFRGGEPVKMSKRSGTFVTMRDVVDEVGAGVTRFIMLTRKNDAPLDFDFEKVTEQSKDNPVFYVQYAHARICSVLRKATAVLSDQKLTDESLRDADLSMLVHEGEIALIKRLAQWGRMVESAAEAHEPHRIAFYLYDLASEFHSHWNRGNDNPGLRFILEDNLPLTHSRLALIRSVAIVIASGLEILGVEPVKEM